MPAPFATPRLVDSLDDCVFYHTIDLPEHGLQSGMWDLRANVDSYLGRVAFAGKRVLELGTANGYLCFHMEREGAEVVAFDVAPDMTVDVVPYARGDVAARVAEMEPWLEKMRNAYWLAHRQLGSTASVVYGDIYDLPAEIGQVDISTFGAILLHLRDPFWAMHRALRLTTETVIVTEPIWHWLNLLRSLMPFSKLGRSQVFLPDAGRGHPPTTWWFLPPLVVREYLAVLGFERSRVSFHFQRHEETQRRVLCYTVVGRRTVPIGATPT